MQLTVLAFTATKQHHNISLGLSLFSLLVFNIEYGTTLRIL